MDAAFERQVRERAYLMWVASGMDSGSADKHWMAAEQALLNESEQRCGKTTKPAKSAKPRVAKAAAPRRSAKMSAGAPA